MSNEELIRPDRIKEVGIKIIRMLGEENLTALEEIALLDGLLKATRQVIAERIIDDIVCGGE